MKQEHGIAVLSETSARILSDEQVAAFDTEYVDEAKWQAFRSYVATNLRTDEFSVLEVGGGNGVFADRILREFPGASLTVLDLNESILSKNIAHARKQTVVGSALELDRISERYDIVSINWVLHHLVGNTFGESIANIQKALRDSRALLTARGAISCYENLYDGILWDRGPSRLIYGMASLQRPAWLVRLIRRLGANTAGVGVCFQSYRAWLEHFAATGLRCAAHVPFSPFRRRWRVVLMRALALHMKPARPAHFWLTPI